ncbi:glycosyltransferase [Paenibacillus sp. MBLB2552]|uniref:Glycosyltransferase n=1 Tax=Paenibacillus mellifer TaxID=2937794 RepID=A0A9X2BS48_9BACL|nr:glycosyltransferase family 2 protein [Paenibacillus mellifer]MCK8489512.1 glycosyltransferase [Paenibacillus mellifer]
MSSESTTVSIIITVKNNGIDLYTTMESLKVSQSTLPYEVIIVDDGSVDGCCDFLMSYRFDRPFKRIKGEPGISARNIGAAHASGEYLIFCGSHLYYDDGWMERLLAPLMLGQAVGVSPAFKKSEHSPAPKGREVGGVMGAVRGYPVLSAGQNEIPWMSWECFAVRRDIFRDMGGMEDGFIGKDLETAEISLRLWLQGGNCLYVPEVTLTQVFRQNFPYDNSGELWGVGLMTLAYLHFDEEFISVCREQVRRAYEGEPVNEEKLVELTSARREKQVALRKHDMRWFSERFGFLWK